MLEAIELVKSTPAGEVSADQLANLRKLLEKTPSLYSMLGGRPAVDAFIQAAESAIQAGSGMAAAAVPRPQSAPGLPIPAGPPPLPFSAAWPRRRLLEVGIFATLITVGVFGFFAVLLSMFGEKDAPAKPIANSFASQAGGTKPEGVPAAVGTKQQSANPGSSKDQASVDEPPDVWQGWKITKAAAGRADKVHGWDLDDPAQPRPIFRLVTAGGGLTFASQQHVPDNAASMRIDCVQSATAPPGSIELIIDGKPSGKSVVPPPGTSEPILLPLTLQPGKPVAIQVVYQPGGPNEEVDWRRLTLSDERVEAMAPNGELDVARPSLRLWLRADRGIKDAAGRGPRNAGFDGQAKTWEDQSSHKFHLTSEGNTPPKLEPADAMLSGKPGVSLGSGAYLSHRGNSLYDTPTSTTLIVFTVRGLARKQRSSTSAVAETSLPGFGWRSGAYHDGRGRYGHEVTFLAGPKSMTSKMIPMGSYALIAAAKIHDRHSFIEINGRNRMFVEVAGAPSGDVFILGGSHAAPGSYGGTIGEVIIFNRGLSAVELRQVGKYLQARYGIAGDY